jgi:glycosyltransferase involved in cell wall biosynthesis
MEARAHRNGVMTRFSAQSGTSVESSASWLSSRSQGRCPAGAVLLHAPSFAFQAPGGGENQLVQTGRHLEELGVPVRLFSPWTDRLEQARLLHLFGMSREGIELARRAKARGTPVVLSPICWYEPRALWALETGLARKLGSLGAWSLRRWASRLPGWRRELLLLADRILPSSNAEARQLTALFGVDRERVRVVPNGVLASFHWASPSRFRGRFGNDDFVLFVGRIEPRKNPLGLIRAVRALGLRLVIIGAAPPGCQSYHERCKAEGGDRVRWLQQRDHHDPLLASAYAAARVFALPSWFETPGLAALEASLAGAAVVITPYGSTREYFGDRVVYTRPDRVTEISRAISWCWSQGPDSRLAEHVASNFLWPQVAKQTAEVYAQVSK